MITTLTIKNYALIEDIKVDFNKGLTVITGETGAGKSILLSALGLVLGNRADLKVARNPEEKCIVEAEFTLAKYGLKPLFENNGMDYEDHTILRREISPNGKSRAFVNDSPVTLQQLSVLGDFLIDIHNQNDAQLLHSETYQMEMIDTLAGNKQILRTYVESLRQYNTLSERLSALKGEKAAALKEFDYHQFLYDELQQAQLFNIHQVSLEEELEKLNNTEEIQETLSQCLQFLNAEEIGAIGQLHQVRSLLQKIQPYAKEYQALWERVQSVSIELQDIADEMQQSAESLEADPQLLQELNEKLQNLYRLQQKHAVGTVEGLQAIENELGAKLQQFSSLDDDIHTLEKTQKEAWEKTKALAADLYRTREQSFSKLKEKLETILKDLGLPHAQFEFHLEHTDHFKKYGMDTLQILFTANKGEKPGPIEKVASGGEVSRVMLAIKSVLADYKELPTIIFDEIDTGVSGEIAHKMATILSQMSKSVQLFSITHLPQTAAKGDFHKKVFKQEDSDRTKTLIKDLSQEERILEIAQMIGGSTVSDSAITHAKQLLN